MKTTNYEMFKFREDNRQAIDQSHVKKLIESIKAKNLLELRPITVNEKFEIIDGQHRLLAAQELGVEIYYNVEKSMDAGDIIIMNISKAWTSGDYLNFYVKNGYEEYIKLKNFMEKNDITLRVALNICLGSTNNVHSAYKQGKLRFEEIPMQEDIELCRETIAFIKRMNGFSNWTESGKFWKALLMLFRHPDFKVAKWFNNLDKMVGRMNVKATTKDYCRLVMEIYNYRNSERINILDEV